MARRLSLLLAVVWIAGCGQSGPATTSTNSSRYATVQERADFLHQYVTFRRTYETLDFDITYHNNSGIVPGPSDWDVRLIATVPASELEAWVPRGVPAAPAVQDRQWLQSVPTSLDLSGISEWYDEGRRIVGLDRIRRIVVYRIWAN